MSEMTIDELATKIASQLMVPIDQQVWTAERCAQYLDIDPKHFAQRIAVMPGFPEARRYPTTAGKMHARWIAGEVIEWATRKR